MSVSFEIWSWHKKVNQYQDEYKDPFTVDWYTFLIGKAYEEHFRYERIKNSLSGSHPDNLDESKVYDMACKKSKRNLILVEYMRYRVSLIKLKDRLTIENLVGVNGVLSEELIEAGLRF